MLQRILNKMTPLQTIFKCEHENADSRSGAELERRGTTVLDIQRAAMRPHAFLRVLCTASSSSGSDKKTDQAFGGTFVLKGGYSKYKERIFNFKGFLKNQRKRIARTLLYTGHLLTRRQCWSRCMANIKGSDRRLSVMTAHKRNRKRSGDGESECEKHYDSQQFHEIITVFNQAIAISVRRPSSCNVHAQFRIIVISAR